MYPEFIAIYVGLLIVIGLLVTILVLMLKKQNDNSRSTANYTAKQNTLETNASSSGSIVFCKKCAAEFDSTQKCCPKCGTPR